MNASVVDALSYKVILVREMLRSGVHFGILRQFQC